MIEELLKNRKYVSKYDTDANISESLIDSLLEKTWRVTPSKNNFMPYTIHVLGPRHQKYKELVFQHCLTAEGNFDNVEDVLKERHQNKPPNYANILNCSYLFIFTMRLETQLNQQQQDAVKSGHRYLAANRSRLDELLPIASLEVGMFINTFSALCLEHNIDTSLTGCFSHNIKKWKAIPFVKRTPIIIMTAGKAKIYRQDFARENYELRPNYERIVNFVKEKSK